jgi:hypothetical protein
MGPIHAQLATTMALYYLVVGLWGLLLGLRRSELDGGYRGALVLALGLAVLQGLVGLGLMVFEGRFPRETHYLYGVSAIVTLPLVHWFVATRVNPPLVYGLGCLFMFGLALRGMATF